MVFFPKDRLQQILLNALIPVVRSNSSFLRFEKIELVLNKLKGTETVCEYRYRQYV